VLSGRSKGNYPTGNSKADSRLHNLFVSLLNHFSLTGMVSLRSAFQYLVNPKNGEADLSIDKLPVTMIVHDLVTMLKAMSRYADTHYFDQSNLLLDDTLYRDYLVGEKLLPFWGYRTDIRIMYSFKKLGESYFNLRGQIIQHMTPHIFPTPLENGTAFEIDFHYFIGQLVDSFFYRGKDPGGEIIKLRIAHKEMNQFKSFERCFQVREDLTLFLERYRLLEHLGIDDMQGMKVPSPLKDIQHTIDAVNQLRKGDGPNVPLLMHYLHSQKSPKVLDKNVLFNRNAYIFGWESGYW
jgi:hypothetical protein